MRTLAPAARSLTRDLAGRHEVKLELPVLQHGLESATGPGKNHPKPDVFPYCWLTVSSFTVDPPYTLAPELPFLTPTMYDRSTRARPRVRVLLQR